MTVSSASWSTPGTGTCASAAHDDQHPQDEEDPAPDVRRAEGVDEGVEHRVSGRRAASGSASASASGRLAVGRRLRLGDRASALGRRVACGSASRLERARRLSASASAAVVSAQLRATVWTVPPAASIFCGRWP